MKKNVDLRRYELEKGKNRVMKAPIEFQNPLF
jgi:hypothetical protein